jgi:hypothetical protein
VKTRSRGLGSRSRRGPLDVDCQESGPNRNEFASK